MVYLIDFLNWAFRHVIEIAAGFFIVFKWRELYNALLLQPLRGGNGVVQMDELVKYILMVFLGVMIYYEGKSTEQVFPESVFWIMVIGVFLIAGVKEFSILLKNGADKFKK